MNEPIPATVTIRADHGNTNRRLLAREQADHFKRIESSSRKMPILLSSPEGKRLYLRCFDIAQSNFHFIAVFARIKLPASEIEEIEQQIQDMLEHRIQRLNQALADTEIQCKKHGITFLSSYDVVPMHIEARVFSKFGKQLLDLIEKVDALMPMLETLCIDGAISTAFLNAEKSRLKRVVRSVTGTSRSVRASLERRMNNLPPLGANKTPTASASASASADFVTHPIVRAAQAS